MEKPPMYNPGMDNPGYSQGYNAPAYNTPQYGNQTVTTQQPGQHTVVVPGGTNTVIVQQPVPHPPNYMWLSCLVYWCCNCIAGAIAFGLSMASSSAADEGRTDEARQYGKASLWTSIIGVVLGVIAIIVIIILYVTTWKATYDDLKDNYYYNN